MSGPLARNCWHIICTSDVSQSSSVASSHRCLQLMKFKDIKSVLVNRQKCLSLTLWFFYSVCRAKYSANITKPAASRDGTKPVTSGQLDTSELVQLLQRSAVEHLTTCRQLQLLDFGSVVTIVTTDYEAL